MKEKKYSSELSFSLSWGFCLLCQISIIVMPFLFSPLLKVSLTHLEGGEKINKELRLDFVAALRNSLATASSRGSELLSLVVSPRSCSVILCQAGWRRAAQLLAAG